MVLELTHAWIPAIVGCLVTFAVALTLVLTQRFHGHLSIDTLVGVQKFHTKPTPRIGGLAITSGVVAAYFSSHEQIQVILLPMLLAGIPALVAGTLEDLTKRVGVLPRLFATMFSGVLAFYLTGIAMRNTGVPAIDWILAFTPIAIAFTAFAVGGVANAINIIDGFNGLASGAVVIMSTGMGIIALEVGDAGLATVCFTLAAVMFGFGLINWPMGHIFLGDGGAYLIGFLLGWIAVLLPMRNPSVTAWATLLVCAYPVLEVAFSYRRKSKREGHHPGQPDRVHLHMLMFRRLSRKAYPNANITLQNGLTSPYAWCYTMFPVTWAIMFFDQPLLLAFGLFLSAIIYWMIYQRLTQFKWCRLTSISFRSRA
jgi:UDP-N-acetylmuramyl pentapeptide phosphotransferase/UDP-N-acetylglucosamine-1-phosphate transferase